MKKRWTRGLLSLLTVTLLVCAIMQAYAFFEKQDCICAKLTAEEKEFEIDDRLRNFYPDAEKQTGVFIRASSPCRHGKHIQLTIYPDEGIYRGKLAK